ncbi:hypothetical protein B0H16DRAFT_1776964 [Mycena metata]|uniref:Uncharacterized protein n=1 Tax=Mycena metata TaxID=1033252 RepID=A0AAD7JTH3_9AGAR|nr:hypothetical protein B0H16DRAFT_1776964 [Mycena metata]
MPKSKTSSKEKKPSRAKKSVELPDESQWRAEQISKTNAISQYRVTPALLEPLSFTTSSVLRDNKVFSVMLYNECEVELLAWRKYGGPEGFEDHLNELRKRHTERKTKKEFQVPEVYKPAERSAGPSSRVILIQPAPPQVRAASDPLRPLHQRFVDIGRLWLWEAANDVLAASADAFGNERLSAREKQAALGDASLTGPAAYPLRPASLAPASPAYTVFREVLALAPSKHDKKTRGQLELNENLFQAETIYYWSQDYMVELFNSLIAVITEHGIEGIGWKSARWEVYDTYTRCIQSLYFSYAHNRWYDDAKDWLYGRMELGSSGTLTPRQDNKSELGKIYNEMLPLLAPGE